MKFKEIQIMVLTVFFCVSSLSAYASSLAPSQISILHIKDNQLAKQMAAISAQAEAAYPWRGLLMSGDHGAGDIHHDNVYVSIDGGPIIYQTTIPARKQGNLLVDEGLLWHFYTRDDTEITVYATSAWVNGLESDLSTPFPLYFSYPQPETCTEQTVPVSVAGEDQFVDVGSLVTLDASQSYDGYAPDNDDLAYRWECYSAPEAAVVLSDEGSASVVNFTPNVPGNYYFRLSLRDKIEGETFNRSPVSYVRVSAVADMANQSYMSANSGRTQQIYLGELVTLDGSQSQSSDPITSYTWTQENPLGVSDIQNMGNLLGTTQCQGQCYLSNFDANNQVDGMDLALLAVNYSGVDLPNQSVVQFVAGIARPHIFKLTVSDGIRSDVETTIVAVSHLNTVSVLTHPPVDNSCLE